MNFLYHYQKSNYSQDIKLNYTAHNTPNNKHFWNVTRSAIQYSETYYVNNKIHSHNNYTIYIIHSKTYLVFSAWMVNLAFEGSEVLITSENIFCRWKQLRLELHNFIFHINVEHINYSRSFFCFVSRASCVSLWMINQLDALNFSNIFICLPLSTCFGHYVFTYSAHKTHS
jgi:hypothetical protein